MNNVVVRVIGPENEFWLCICNTNKCRFCVNINHIICTLCVSYQIILIFSVVLFFVIRYQLCSHLDLMTMTTDLITQKMLPLLSFNLENLWSCWYLHIYVLLKFILVFHTHSFFKNWIWNYHFTKYTSAAQTAIYYNCYLPLPFFLFFNCNSCAYYSTLD